MNKHKNSFLGTIIIVLILYSILSYIWDNFHTVIIIGLFSILFTACLIFIIYNQKHVKLKNANQQDTFLTREQKNNEIQKQMKTLLESNELMNNSKSLGTVINRYRMICNTIDELSVYDNEELLAAGYKLKTPLEDTKAYIQKNKTEIINQAIERNVSDKIDSVVAVDEKLKKLEVIYQDIKCNMPLAPDNLSFLDELLNLPTSKSGVAA